MDLREGVFLESDAVPDQPFDPGDRGPADALDSERDDRGERRSPMLATVGEGPFR